MRRMFLGTVPLVLRDYMYFLQASALSVSRLA